MTGMNDPEKLIGLLDKIRAQTNAAETQSEARALWLRIYATAYEDGKELAQCSVDATLAVQDYEKWLTRYRPESPVDVDALIRAMEGKKYEP